MKINYGEKFSKDLKKLLKKYISLEYDLQKTIRRLKRIPKGNESKHLNILKKENEKYIFKMRMMCKSLQSSSFRIIYYYDGKNIELEFIELYFKGKKETEDQQRIEAIWKEKTIT